MTTTGKARRIQLFSLATPQMAAQFPDLMPSVYGSTLLPHPAEYRART